MKRDFIIDADNIEVVEIYTGREYKTPKTPTNAETRIFEQWRYEMQTRYWNLPIIMLPNGMWVPRDEHLLKLNNTIHRAIRHLLLKTDGRMCSACGFKPDVPRLLSAHEVLNFDRRRHILVFVRYRLLCKDCHYLTHQGYWALGNKALMKRFCKVNGCKRVYRRFVGNFSATGGE